MKAIRTGAKPSTLDALEWVDIDAAAAPGPGEITVDLKASSLNYHDYAVVKGMIPTEPGRIPMSDGAGIVSAVGDGVTEFAVGDQVVSTFTNFFMKISRTDMKDCQISTATTSVMSPNPSSIHSNETSCPNTPAD